MIPRRTRKAMSVIAFAFLGTLLLAWLAEKSGSWLAKFGVLPFIAALQNHLQILQHDGAHGLLHPNRRWNDVLADVFCSLPFGGFLRHYRYFHFQHHAHVTDATRDPEIEFYRQQGYEFRPLSRGRRLWLSFLDFIGVHSLQFLISYNLYLWREGRQVPSLRLRLHDELAAAVFVATLVAIAMFQPRWLPLITFYWLLPANTWLFFFMKLHGLQEHGARTGGPLEEFTHDRDPSVLARFFISPLNSHAHRTHHRNPRVPWFELPSIDEGNKTPALK